MRHPTPMCALGWMTAVAWMSDMSRLPAFHQDERDLGLAHGFVADAADALRLADLAAALGQFDLDHERVAGTDRLAPLDALRRHEVGEAPEVLGLFQHEDAGGLSHRLQLQY